MLFLFLDTNVFIQCLSLEELPWNDLFPEKSEIQLVVPRVVIAELDRLKNDVSARRSKRARYAASKFREMLQTQDKK
jgi:rRNA-processing protein FCF1